MLPKSHTPFVQAGSTALNLPCNAKYLNNNITHSPSPQSRFVGNIFRDPCSVSYYIATKIIIWETEGKYHSQKDFDHFFFLEFTWFMGLSRRMNKMNAEQIEFQKDIQGGQQ